MFVLKYAALQFARKIHFTFHELYSNNLKLIYFQKAISFQIFTVVKMVNKVDFSNSKHQKHFKKTLKLCSKLYDV